MTYKPWKVLIITLQLVVTINLFGCGKGAAPGATVQKPEALLELPPSLESVPISLSPSVTGLVPKGARIVIADIGGECSQEVKDALVRRLIDNTNYNVLAREHLRQIILENEGEWAGDFNTQTSTKLGRLLGASLWIVGKVTFCGRSLQQNVSALDAGDFTIDATLQIIDLETRRVLISSFSQGSYSKPLTQYLNQEPALLDFLRERKRMNEINELSDTKTQQPGTGDIADQTEPNETKQAASLPEPIEATPTYRSPEEAKMLREHGIKAQPADKKKETRSWPNRTRLSNRAKSGAPERYAKKRAADELANKFADKFFSRPFWEFVQMWHTDEWLYSKAVAYVQLGQCPLGVKFLTNEASKELDQLDKKHLSNYLHNLGVTLLCSNRIDEAKERLRSAYRVDRNLVTLRMLGLASKISEWQLSAEVDGSPEIQQLFESGPPDPADD